MKNHIPATPLIVRTEDIAAIARAVRQGTRLVTLVGPPGIGKTRLAVAVAETLAAERADGVYFVALDAVRDADLIAPTIGQALGVAEVAGQPFAETLVRYLRDTRAIRAIQQPVVNLAYDHRSQQGNILRGIQQPRKPQQSIG